MESNNKIYKDIKYIFAALIWDRDKLRRAEIICLHLEGAGDKKED